MAWVNELFKQRIVAWGSMDYFGESTEIGILCRLGLLRAINLVGRPHWRPIVCISCYMNVSPYFRFLFRKTSFCCGLWWPKCMGKVFTGVGSIFPKGHKKFVHFSTPWHIMLCMHSQWCLPTLVAEIFVGKLYLSLTWGAYNIGC